MSPSKKAAEAKAEREREEFARQQAERENEAAPTRDEVEALFAPAEEVDAEPVLSEKPEGPLMTESGP